MVRALQRAREHAGRTGRRLVRRLQWGPDQRGHLERGSWRFDAVLQPETRDAYQRLLAQGWIDSARFLNPKGRGELYTFWVNDHAFRRNAGFRMDFLLLSPGLGSRLQASGVDAEHRGREKPSDHAPVWVELRD
jgi:exodeoxyribonuclease-3